MTRTEMKTLWIASFNASAKYRRNVAKAQFADAQRNGSQFSDFADLLARLDAQVAKTMEAATAASTDPVIIAEAAAEWKAAA